MEILILGGAGMVGQKLLKKIIESMIFLINQLLFIEHTTTRNKKKA